MTSEGVVTVTGMTDTPTPLEVGTVADELPRGRGRTKDLTSDRDLMDANPDRWVVLAADIGENGGAAAHKRAAEKWTGDYEFATRTTDGIRNLWGRHNTPTES